VRLPVRFPRDASCMHSYLPKWPQLWTKYRHVDEKGRRTTWPMILQLQRLGIFQRLVARNAS
jgi:hypothetical protein